MLRSRWPGVKAGVELAVLGKAEFACSRVIVGCDMASNFQKILETDRCAQGRPRTAIEYTDTREQFSLQEVAERFGRERISGSGYFIQPSEKMAEGANPAGFSSAEQLFPVAREGATNNL